MFTVSSLLEPFGSRFIEFCQYNSSIKRLPISHWKCWKYHYRATRFKIFLGEDGPDPPPPNKFVSPVRVFKRNPPPLPPGEIALCRSWSRMWNFRICSCFVCVYRVMDARGKFGEHERCVRVAQGGTTLPTQLTASGSPWMTNVCQIVVADCSSFFIWKYPEANF